MSHRYPKKLRIAEEGEESSCAPPHLLDSIFRHVSLLIDVNPIERLSEEEKKELGEDVIEAMPHLMHYLLLQNYEHELYRRLMEKYRFKDREMEALMNAMLYFGSVEIEKILRTEGQVVLEYRFLKNSGETEEIHGE